ncbi:peptidoglycan-binding domain-containing protein [Priestia megaterium]|uniref:peptidoglycan-binding domain-containing protein n=1 Tax=Priestia megaterium TaxID=1404 RepID=UPI00286B27A2|nr:peptidoglycan-binding domain-containing protein [Priestia megaterium]
MKLRYELSKYEDDKFYGDKTINAVKAFQKANGIIEDGIAGEKTIAKIAVLINALNKPKERDLPKVTSLGDMYSFQVKATKGIGIYKYANLAENFKALKEGAVFSVCGYKEGLKAYAVPGGFVQAKDVNPLSVTLTTGGLNKDMEMDLRAFLKKERINGELNIHAKGNPDAEIILSGPEVVKVKQFLDTKGWYYK